MLDSKVYGMFYELCYILDCMLFLRGRTKNYALMCVDQKKVSFYY